MVAPPLELNGHVSLMANILFLRTKSKPDIHRRQRLQNSSLYVNCEEFYQTREEMWSANSDAVGS